MPERFQACKEKFNVIITCEERVYDQVIEGRKLLISFINHFVDNLISGSNIAINSKFNPYFD